MKRILIMAGGSGGHIIPALTVARSLQQQQVEVHWLGSCNGLENQLVSSEFPIHSIEVQRIRGKGLAELCKAPAGIFRAVSAAKKIIHQLNPDAVVGFGGFASGPGGIAAWWLNKPLIIQEQNSVAGLTNRVLARFAKCVFQAFPNTFPSNLKPITAGNPIRPEIIAMTTPEERFTYRHGPLRLLILGGSQGASIFNELIPSAVAAMPKTLQPQVWHSAGKQHAESTQQIYHQLKLEAKVVGFIDDMAAAYTWADLVICRAGALTIAELTAAGVGSILIPYPHAVDDHQTQNSQFLVQADAAVLVPQTTLTAERLTTLLTELANNRPRLLAMAKAARALAMPHATQRVTDECMKFVSKFD